jgi:hypothetical protein
MPCGFEYSALGSHRIDDLLIGSPYCALHLDAESDQGIALIYEHCPRRDQGIFGAGSLSSF